MTVPAGAPHSVRMRPAFVLAAGSVTRGPRVIRPCRAVGHFRGENAPTLRELITGRSCGPRDDQFLIRPEPRPGHRTEQRQSSTWNRTVGDVRARAAAFGRV